jgi:hypothetical protein
VCVLSFHLPGETDKNKKVSEYSVFQQRFKSQTSRISGRRYPLDHDFQWANIKINLKRNLSTESFVQRSSSKGGSGPLGSMKDDNYLR